MHGKIDADVIVMGSSRAWVHVNPIILDSILNTSTYNLGIDGSMIDRQIRKYNLYRIYNRKPKLIIQNIDQGTLNKTNGFQREQFFPYFWDRAMRGEFYDVEPLSVWDKYVPMYRYWRNYDIKQLFEMSFSRQQRLTKGYEGRDQPWDDSKYKEQKSIRFLPNDTTM